jgi:hypothetical protein
MANCVLGTMTHETPKFFFRLCDEFGCEDEEGMQLPDTDSAIDEAIRGARSIMAEQVTKGRLSLKPRIDILDEAGSIAASVAFRDVVDIDA